MDVLYPVEVKPVNQNDHDLELEELDRKNGNPKGLVFSELDYHPSGWLETNLMRASSSTEEFMKHHGDTMRTISIFILNGLVVGFFFGCLYYWMTISTEPLELCDGFGSLIAFLTIVYFFIIYFLIVKRFFGSWFYEKIWRKVDERLGAVWKITWFRWGFSFAIVGILAAFILWDTWEASYRLISLSGLAIILLLSFVFSAHPGRVNWRTVLMGLLIQFIFGIIFIRWETGRVALQCFSDKVATFLSYGVDGAAFAFGDLLVRQEGVFAFSTLPVIFFFSMLVEVLFYWGALQWFVLKLGQLLQSATSTTVCESVICVGNVFLGMSESALLIKPYISQLTPSEIHTVMASGFATVSGTILAAYIAFGAEPAHLVTASVMSAPAAVCLAKLLMPETKRSLTSADNIQTQVSGNGSRYQWIQLGVICADLSIALLHEDQSALSAATRGATNGIALVLNIIANIVAFVAFIAFLNGVMGYAGGLLGNPDLTLEWVLGKIFIPLCFVMGVPWEECEAVGTLIGLKTMVNEFVAYQRMGEMKEEGLLSPRSELIATYSLCGFTNPASAGIMIGAMAAMAPNQREVLSSVAVRAFFAGCGICFMTACIAALLMPDGSFV